MYVFFEFFISYTIKYGLSRGDSVENIGKIAKDFEKKLERTLTENEIEFIKWMIINNKRECGLLSSEEDLKQA